MAATYNAKRPDERQTDRNARRQITNIEVPFKSCVSTAFLTNDCPFMEKSVAPVEEKPTAAFERMELSQIKELVQSSEENTVRHPKPTTLIKNETGMTQQTQVHYRQGKIALETEPQDDEDDYEEDMLHFDKEKPHCRTQEQYLKLPSDTPSYEEEESHTEKDGYEEHDKKKDKKELESDVEANADEFEDIGDDMLGEEYL